MINCADIQLCYNDLYRNVRNYIWEFSAVEDLADLEISVYQTCPSLSSIRSAFYRFRQHVSRLLNDDEELCSAVDAFQDLIESDDSVYSDIKQVQEVVSR